MKVPTLVHTNVQELHFMAITFLLPVNSHPVFIQIATNVHLP